MLTLRQDGPDVLFEVAVQPRAARDEIAGIQGDVLKIRLSAPPVEGAANRACLAFLADLLDLPPRRVKLASGQKARRKLIRIAGASPDEIRRRLAPHLAPR